MKSMLTHTDFHHLFPFSVFHCRGYDSKNISPCYHTYSVNVLILSQPSVFTSSSHSGFLLPRNWYTSPVFTWVTQLHCQLHLCILYPSLAGQLFMYGFSLKSGAQHFNQLSTIKLIHFLLVRRCPIMNRQAHPLSEFI